MKLPLEWLLDGEAWIEYRVRRDLLGQAEDHPAVIRARHLMLASAPVQRLILELQQWPGAVIASHKNAGQAFHQLTFLADLGLSAANPGMAVILDHIFEHSSEEGPFQILMNIPIHFGGTGRNQWAWALCDAPLISYALIKFGLYHKPGVQTAINYLAGLARDTGWPCAVSPQLGRFRGPGRKEDPCPFATLAMLKLLAEIPEWHTAPACRTGAETLLNLWRHSMTQHPYIFYMGTDFRKLKVPMIWYDLLHVLDVLTHFCWLRGDPRLVEMVTVLTSKADPEGRFTPESIWSAWKDWEFSQKKKPSRWLTLAAWRIIQRFGQEPV